MNNDIIWGIRNAIERGYSLEQVTKSYIDAGYSAAEVNEAVQSLTSGSTSLTINPQTSPVNQTKPAQENTPKETIPSYQSKAWTKDLSGHVESSPKNLPSIPAPAAGMIPQRPIPSITSNNPAQMSALRQTPNVYPSPPASSNNYLPRPNDPNTSESSGKRKTLVIILIILLAILVMGLAGVFIFSKEILQFLSGSV